MFLQRSKLGNFIFGMLAVVVAAIAIGVVSSAEKTDVEKMELKYSNAPVKLYKTVGIKSCSSDFRFKNAGQHVAMLYAEDIDVLAKDLGPELANRVTMILITKDGDGVPIIVLLEKNDGRYCGIATMQSNGNILSGLIEKYKDNRD